MKKIELTQFNTFLCAFLTEYNEELAKESKTANADEFTVKDTFECLKKLLTV